MSIDAYARAFRLQESRFSSETINANKFEQILQTSKNTSDTYSLLVEITNDTWLK